MATQKTEHLYYFYNETREERHLATERFATDQDAVNFGTTLARRFKCKVTIYKYGWMLIRTKIVNDRYALLEEVA